MLLRMEILLIGNLNNFMQDFFKRFIVLISLGFILFGFNFTNAIAEENLICTTPQILNESGDDCIDVEIESEPLACTLPQILNETGDACIDPAPVPIVCTEPQILIDGVCANPVVEPKPDSVKIHLEIISGDDSLYDSDILVTACDNEGDGVMKITPYCALVQSGVLSDWSGLWINSIGGFSNDFTNNIYWMWLANLNIDNTSPSSSYNLSAKQYELSSNDQILFYYNTNPLNISVDNLAPTINDVITVKVTELSLDSSWNPIWVPSLLSKVAVSSNVFDVDENGEYKINILNTDPLTILGQKDGFISSSLITITPVVSNQGDNDEGDNNNSGGGSGNSIEKNFSINNAISFLLANYNDSLDSLYTDWLAVGITKAGSQAKPLRNNLIEFYQSGDFDLSSITDYERHAMALMSLGIDPRSGTDINYIDEIVSSFDGQQIGDDSLYNDDIFALIVFAHAGFDEDDEIIKEIVSFMISNQSGNGSWGSTDMTAAAIEALSNFKNLDDVEDAISKGESYLIGKQKTDGSFENVFSTSWAVQALSLNNSFDEETKSAIEYLKNHQENDGSMIDGEINNKVWATAYALPAISRLSWNDILDSFDKEDDGENDEEVEDNDDTIDKMEENISEVNQVLQTEEQVAWPLQEEIKEKLQPIKLVKNETKRKDNQIRMVDNDQKGPANLLPASVAQAVPSDLTKNFLKVVSDFFMNLWNWIFKVFI